MIRPITILMLLTLASCGEISGAGGSADVVEYTLKDGTKCAILIGAYQGGITCAWDSTGPYIRGLN